MHDAENATSSTGEGFRARRREVLKAGVVLLPTIATLHATPAWAQTDYTMTAYRYGANAGLCRNPKFDPRAEPGSPESEEFIRCPGEGYRPTIEWEVEQQSQGRGGTSAIGD
jgi:hypothetical protein